MKFKKIVIADRCHLSAAVLEVLGGYSEEKMRFYGEDPVSEEELIARIGGAEALLVSWRTAVTAEVIRRSHSLKYIGMCCSLYDESSANVDIKAARAQGITVKGVRDYGDEGTNEFLFSQLIALFKGYGKYQWREQTHELKGKAIGIVGMGTLGEKVARTAIHFGMEVFYYSRTRKPVVEALGVRFMPLNELSARCDVITTHLPKHTLLLDAPFFENKKKNSVLINTSLGPTFDKKAMLNWLMKDSGSYAIFDMEGAGHFREEFAEKDRIILYPRSSGSTAEALERLSVKVLENLREYCSGRRDK